MPRDGFTNYHPTKATCAVEKPPDSVVVIVDMCPPTPKRVAVPLARAPVANEP